MCVLSSSGPTISIVTVNLNNSCGLEKTIASVISQNYSQIEYLLIDGGSTDESVAIIEKHSNHLTYKVSEPDNGVYAAMNKGVKKATKEYILFLNSGDVFYSGSSIQQLAGVSNGHDFIYGDLIVREGTHDWVKSYPSNLSFSYFLKDSLPHPCTLIKRSLFASIGMYNEKLKIVSDWEFFVNAICRYNATYKHIDQPIAIFSFHGLSSKSENQELLWHERDTILKKGFGMFLTDYSHHQKVEESLNLIMNSRFQKLINKMKNTAIYKAFKR